MTSLQIYLKLNHSNFFTLWSSQYVQNFCWRKKLLSKETLIIKFLKNGTSALFAWAYGLCLLPIQIKPFNHSTNETGPLPLCTFSVMGLSMCSSIFSESSPLRSKSGIINELSGFPNSVPTVRCSVTSSNWHGHTGHAYCICFVGKH